MKTKLLLIALLFPLMGCGQPNDAPVNLPIGTIDTFYLHSWAYFPKGNVKDSFEVVHAFVFELVDNRKLVPYFKNGPCRPVGKMMWEQRRILLPAQMLGGNREEWLPYNYVPPYETEGDFYTWWPGRVK